MHDDQEVEMDAMSFLREDHEKVLAMLDELERGPGERTPESLAAHKRLVTELVIAESEHEAVEEEYFWPSVQHWLEEGRDLAAPALEQEQEAKQVLQRLEELEPDDAEFETLVSRIVADGRAHIVYEERTVWPLVRERVSHTELDEVGEKMARAKKIAPTRPHPHTPPRAGVLKSAGPAVAGLDKLRDMATGRGREG
ncbi:hemerythrin domain-containing protein [Pseudonocardia sp.]|uniref:hemerythrin domain-containing protein n=1 Tax=Pseudonocardia sp. TaxID=60912 RepID=UPI0031FBFCC2